MAVLSRDGPQEAQRLEVDAVVGDGVREDREEGDEEARDGQIRLAQGPPEAIWVWVNGLLYVILADSTTCRTDHILLF